MLTLTARQAQVLSLIRSSLDDRGYPPSVREIGESMGIKSTNGVNDHLKALIRKGYIERDGRGSRTLRLIGARIEQPVEDLPAGWRWSDDRIAAIGPAFEDANGDSIDQRVEIFDDTIEMVAQPGPDVVRVVQAVLSKAARRATGSS